MAPLQGGTTTLRYHHSRNRLRHGFCRVPSCCTPVLSHTTSTRASLGTSSREALPDWLAVLPAPLPAGQGYWQSRLARPRRWPEPGPPSSLRWLPPRQTENRQARGQSDTGVAQRGQRGRREVISGPDRKHKRNKPPPPAVIQSREGY